MRPPKHIIEMLDSWRDGPLSSVEAEILLAWLNESDENRCRLLEYFRLEVDLFELLKNG
jgi:hypothetical protein